MTIFAFELLDGLPQCIWRRCSSEHLFANHDGGDGCDRHVFAGMTQSFAMAFGICSSFECLLGLVGIKSCIGGNFYQDLGITDVAIFLKEGAQNTHGVGVVQPFVLRHGQEFERLVSSRLGRNGWQPDRNRESFCKGIDSLTPNSW